MKQNITKPLKKSQIKQNIIKFKKSSQMKQNNRKPKINLLK